MNRAKIPVAEYEQLAKQFDPVKFDADAWVRLAHDAGMKYIVITSKHHDGFAMFGSSWPPPSSPSARATRRVCCKVFSSAACRRCRSCRLRRTRSPSP